MRPSDLRSLVSLALPQPGLELRVDRRRPLRTGHLGAHFAFRDHDGRSDGDAEAFAEVSPSVDVDSIDEERFEVASALNDLSEVALAATRGTLLRVVEKNPAREGHPKGVRPWLHRA